MSCPNKNDKNWKAIVGALGETAAYAIHVNGGIPNITEHPNYTMNKNKLSDKQLVLNTLGVMSYDDLDIDKNRAFDLIGNKKLRLSKLNKAITVASKNKDFVEAARLKEQRTGVQESIDKLEDKDKIEDIIQEGKADMAMVSDLLLKDEITDSEIDLARKVLDMWSVGSKLFLFEGEAQLLEAQVGELDIIAGLANRKMEKLNKVSRDSIEKSVKESNGRGIIQTLMKDIGWMKGRLLDISQIADSVINTLFRSVKKANTIAKSRAEARMDKLDDLSKPLSKYGMKKIYDMLAQKDEQGNKTGNMIVNIKPEFHDKKYEKRSRYMSGNEADKQGYVKWLRENEISFDMELIFSPEGEAHRDELRSLLGKQEYDRRVEVQKARLEDYEGTQGAMVIFYDTEYGKGDTANQLLHTWELKNSPYEWAKFIKNPKDKRFTGVKPEGHKYTQAVPAKDSWYDPRYKTIEGDSDLLAYYNYAMRTMSELREILPDDKKAELKSNSIPFIENDIAERYDKEGYRAAASGIMESLIKTTRTKDVNSTYYGYQNPDTLEEEDYLRAPNVEDKTKINEAHKLRIIEFKNENEREPTPEERRELYKEARIAVAEDKSFDLNRVIGAFALMAESYYHLGAVEDQVKLIKHHVNNMKEVAVKNGRGMSNTDHSNHYLSDEEGFKNTRESVGYFIDAAVYGKTKVEEGVSDKDVYTKAEKERLVEIDKLLKTPGLSKSEIEFLTKEKNSLGGKRTMSKVGDGVLKWVQLKGMGYNVLASVSNVLFGLSSNFNHAVGGEDFSMKNYNKAWLTSLNTIGGKGKPKVMALMKKFDVLKESSDELGKSAMSKLGKKVGPYNLNRRGEVLNQSPIMIALMMEEGIWDDFDPDGNYTGKLDFSDEGKDFHNFKAKLDQIIKSLHGNYDPDSPMLVKKKIAGRAVTQFRTWMFESVNNRMGELTYDEILGRAKKGRYRTVMKKEYLFVAPLLRDFYKASRGTYTDGTAEGNVDQANLRKNGIELVLFLALTGAILALGGGDDEEEESSMLRNLLINQIVRLQTDITFYVDPASFESLTKQSVPAMSLIKDYYSIMDASYKMMKGEDKLKAGTFADDSRLAREAAQFFPVTVQVQRAYSSASQIFKKH